MEELLVDAQIPCDPCIAKNLQCEWFCSWWCWRQRRTNVDIWDTLLWGFEPRAFVWPCRGEDWLRLFLSPHRQFGTQYRHLLSAIKELIPKSGRGGYRIRKTLWSETSKQNTLLSVVSTLGSLNIFKPCFSRPSRQVPQIEIEMPPNMNDLFGPLVWTSPWQDHEPSWATWCHVPTCCSCGEWLTLVATVK